MTASQVSSHSINRSEEITLLMEGRDLAPQRVWPLATTSTCASLQPPPITQLGVDRPQH